jgi:hypothetical protein
MADPIRRLAAKLEHQGHEPAVAAAMAKAAARKLGREHAAWARAAGRPEAAALLEALAELEAVQRWRDESVSGFGGGRGVPSDLLLDAALAKLGAATERAGKALADFMAKQRAGVAPRA